MPSSFTWLDYSERDRQRMLDVIDLFKLSDTRDELGIGSVRDALADRLFPGVNTIQSRARYFLFVPWIYLELERQEVSPREIAQKARQAELALVVPLKAAGEGGVFGGIAGQSLQRLPSSIYWLGLGTWGIRQFDGAQSEYHRRLGIFYQRRRTLREGQRDQILSGDNSSEGEERLPRNWHVALPKTPSGFPQGLTFHLTLYEARYLRERILTSARDTYLAFLADRGTGSSSVAFPWLHPLASDAPAGPNRHLNHARNFSETMNGAALLYNLMLAEHRSSGDLANRYRDRLNDWEGLVASRYPALRSWDQNDFWETVRQVNPRISWPARTFINEWLRIVLTEGPPNAIHISQEARDLVSHREHRLKGSLSRFHNPRALELWTGAAGVTQLSYRWNNVQTILNDIDAGLQSGE